MDNYTYNLVSAIMFGILTFAAIFIPLYFSIRASNRTDDKLNEFIRIIAGIDTQTKNILSEIKYSNGKQIEDAFMNFKEEVRPMLKSSLDFSRIEALTRDKITGLSHIIDNNLDNIPFSGASPSASPSPSPEDD